MVQISRPESQHSLSRNNLVHGRGTAGITILAGLGRIGLVDSGYRLEPLGPFTDGIPAFFQNLLVPPKLAEDQRVMASVRCPMRLQIHAIRLHGRDQTADLPHQPLGIPTHHQRPREVTEQLREPARLVVRVVVLQRDGGGSDDFVERLRRTGLSEVGGEALEDVSLEVLFVLAFGILLELVAPSFEHDGRAGRDVFGMHDFHEPLFLVDVRGFGAGVVLESKEGALKEGARFRSIYEVVRVGVWSGYIR